MSTLKHLVPGFTIDPRGAKDLDDACWIEQHADIRILTIHVANVSSLPKHSYLEQRAAERLQTQYLSSGTIPMLPRSLAEDQFSLLPQQERSVLTTVVWLDVNAEVLQVEFQVNTLLSQQQLSYDEADLILNSSVPHPLKAQLQLLEQVAQQLSHNRRDKGAVYGQSIGQDYYLNEEGRVVKQQELYRSQQIVMELMILANTLSADYLRTRNIPALFRNHGYRELGAVHQVLIPILEALGTEQAIRSALAQYYGRATYGTTCQGHVGLDVRGYLHVTSPIRRYADLVNQRVLKSEVLKKEQLYSPQELEAIALRINKQVEEQRQQRSAAAAAESVAAKAVEVVQPEHLAGLSEKEFSKVLELAAKTVQFMSLEEEIRRRLSQGRLVEVDYYTILLGAANGSGTLTLKLDVLQTLKDMPRSVSILNMAMTRLEGCTAVATAIEGGGTQFYGRVIVTIEEAKTAPVWASGRNKTEVKMRAAYQWLDAYICEELVTPDEVEASQVQPANLPKSTTLEKNYVGDLNQYAQQQGLELPTYEFEAGMQGFVCTCELLYYSGKGQAASKKEAKQWAAAAVWEQLPLEQG